MGRIVMLFAAVVVVGMAASAQAWMKEGAYRGKVIVIGEDRIVVAVPDHGQIAFEVAQVKDGDATVQDPAMIARIRTLRKDQDVEVKWGQDHTGHYYIVELTASQAGGERRGVVRGRVISAAPDRVVVGRGEGGQETLELTWNHERGEGPGDLFDALVSQDLKPGDEVIAMWELDEGAHYVVRSICKADAAGQALALVLLQAELQETYQRINQLQDRIGRLEDLLRQTLQALQAKQAEPKQ
jgi:hypothetical protein